MAASADVILFRSIGLSEQKALETLKNDGVSNNLKTAIQEAKSRCSCEIDKSCGILLYHVATRCKKQIQHHITLLATYIATKKIDTEIKLNAAVAYLLANPGSDVDISSFESSCGVGVVVTPEQIEATVEALIKKYKDELTSKRYLFNVGILLGEARGKLKFADGKDVKHEVDMAILTLLGPKTEADLKKPAASKEKGKKPEKEKAGDSVAKPGAVTILELMKTKVNFHKVGENYKTDGYVITPNTMQILQEHAKSIGNQVHTRFPPEPNGILHIGHAKAININFGYAQANGGVTYLRYDDTNPEKEEEKFFTGILAAVEWLGYKPYKITHSSDYFDQLYTWAVELITAGLAYVCHQQADEIKGFNPPPSPWRNRPVHESLQLFTDMKNGKFAEGEATLRMKIQLEEGKQDPVAYRIKYVHHHRTHDTWCVYPTYDYTHCLCDSIENITHSLCTKEFQNRRSSYYWLCNSLNIYCPVQWEYSRLNVNYTVVSKRKIAKLITSGIVKDWDDPRLFTLTALHRRGFPAEAVNNFCALMGVTGAQASVDPDMLEACVRDVLNRTAHRRMMVLEPVKVTISNFPQSAPITVQQPNFPGEPERGEHPIQFTSTIYIDKNDFMEIGDKGYRRLTSTQSCGLRHAGYTLSVTSIVRDAAGAVCELLATCAPVTADNKPRAFIHWLSQPAPCTVRLYDRLFLHKNPEDSEVVPGGFLTDCNTDSLHEYSALCDSSLVGAPVYTNYQFERLGFFCVDTDSTKQNLVFNRTVELKEDSGKN